MENSMGVSLKNKSYFIVLLPYFIVFLFLYIYLKKKKKQKRLIGKDTYTPVSIEALFIIAKIWKHPQRPSIDEWIEKMQYLYIYTME